MWSIYVPLSTRVSLCWNWVTFAPEMASKVEKFMKIQALSRGERRELSMELMMLRWIDDSFYLTWQIDERNFSAALYLIQSRTDFERYLFGSSCNWKVAYILLACYVYNLSDFRLMYISCFKLLSCIFFLNFWHLLNFHHVIFLNFQYQVNCYFR